MWQKITFSALFSLTAYASGNDPNIITETYPNEELTPGEIFHNITEEQVCVIGYSQGIRNVSKETKRKVKKAYGIASRDYDKYSIDHFIPLCLGGTNSPANLWPQRISGLVYGADEKTLSDNYLFNKICQKQLTLKEAQRLIKDNWVAVYLDCCASKRKPDRNALDILNRPRNKHKRPRKPKFMREKDLLQRYYDELAYEDSDSELEDDDFWTDYYKPRITNHNPFDLLFETME